MKRATIDRNRFRMEFYAQAFITLSAAFCQHALPSLKAKNTAFDLTAYGLPLVGSARRGRFWDGINNVGRMG
jgi:hypothetical protein